MAESTDRIRSDYVFSHNVGLTNEYDPVTQTIIDFTGQPAANDRVELSLPARKQNLTATVFIMKFATSGTNGDATASFNFKVRIGGNTAGSVDNIISVIQTHGNHGSEVGFMGNIISAKRETIGSTERLILTWKDDAYRRDNSAVTLVDAAGSDLPVSIYQTWKTDRKHLSPVVPTRLGLPCAFNLRRQAATNSPYKVMLGTQTIT